MPGQTMYVLTGVADRRVARGWTQAILAATAGVSIGTVQTSERGGAVTRLTVAKLAKALDCHWLELTGQTSFP